MQIFDEAFIQNMTKQSEEMVDKDFADIIKNFTYDGLYKRTVLETKVRQLCALSGLTTINALPQLRFHIRAAFRAGCTVAEIKEAIIQMGTYCGIPYMIQALEACEKVIRELEC